MPHTPTDTAYPYPVPGMPDRVSGPDLEAGNAALPLNVGDHLLASVPALVQEGWGTFTLLDDEQFMQLRQCLSRHIESLLAAQQAVSHPFDLEKYHRQVTTDEVHYAISTWAMPNTVIGGLLDVLRQKMEQLLGLPLALKEVEHRGSRDRFLGFRIVRPGKADHNPYHRDAWLPYWQDTVNVWIPVAGFEQGNTLHLIPGTHTLNDAEILKTKKGAVIDGKVYHVPAAVALRQPFTAVRPQLLPGEALVFSPYILHGNGINSLPDRTRVSIELRFCKA